MDFDFNEGQSATRHGSGTDEVDIPRCYGWSGNVREILHSVSPALLLVSNCAMESVAAERRYNGLSLRPSRGKS
jgi:transcriptional regulator with PAS, ATPase and Fis domain